MSNNIFSNLLTNEFKSLYNQAIDAILADEGLTVKCVFKYAGAGNTVFCNNCINDQISGLSSNKYNGTGPSPFAEGTICPVCMGIGTTTTSKSSEIISLACLFDSKYWLNWSSKSANIPDGMIQTICKIELLPKIRNAQEIIVDTDLSRYGNYTYERASDPEPAGLDNKYIITMWKRK